MTSNGNASAWGKKVILEGGKIKNTEIKPEAFYI